MIINFDKIEFENNGGGDEDWEIKATLTGNPDNIIEFAKKLIIEEKWDKYLSNGCSRIDIKDNLINGRYICIYIYSKDGEEIKTINLDDTDDFTDLIYDWDEELLYKVKISHALAIWEDRRLTYSFNEKGLKTEYGTLDIKGEITNY